VVRAQTITLCPSTNATTCADTTNWASGWLVKSGNTTLLVHPAVSSNSTLTGSAKTLQYLPTGFLGTSATFQFDLGMQGCIGNNNRRVTISPQGRATISKVACS
jgi:Tfp pilus assembly protein FimT